MTVLTTTRRLALLTLAALVLTPLAAAQSRDALDIGTALPLADRTMQNASGAATSFGAEMGENGLAVIFWCNTCPWVAKYEDRVLALAKEYEEAGVGFIAVNSNDASEYPDDGFGAMQKRVAEKSYTFPYVVDDGSEAAKAFGASRTPQIFLFDPSRSLVYEGTVDDSPSDPSQVTEEYFRDAMNAVIADTAVTVQKTKAFGCTIKFQ